MDYHNYRLMMLSQFTDEAFEKLIKNPELIREAISDIPNKDLEEVTKYFQAEMKKPKGAALGSFELIGNLFMMRISRYIFEAAKLEAEKTCQREWSYGYQS